MESGFWAVLTHFYGGWPTLWGFKSRARGRLDGVPYPFLGLERVGHVPKPRLAHSNLDGRVRALRNFTVVHMVRAHPFENRERVGHPKGFTTYTSGERVRHPPQSSEAGIGTGAGAVEMEQFPLVCDERNRGGEGERMGSPRIKSAEGSVGARGRAHPFAQRRERVGHPRVLRFILRVRGCATRHPVPTYSGGRGSWYGP
jgi:hypothetical protein